MMPAYTEFPFERIVNVHWHKKDGDGGGGDQEPPPCGMFYSPEVAPMAGVSRWFAFDNQPQMLILSTSSGRPYNSTSRPLALSLAGYHDVPDVYYWGGSNSGYTIIVSDGGGYGTIGIDAFFNVTVQDMTVYTPPDLIVSGEGTVRLEITEFQARVGPIIIGFWGGDPVGTKGFGRGNDNKSEGVSFTMQGHCKYETTGAPPPQPPLLGGNGWPLFNRYPPSPFIPGYPEIIVPPGSRSSRRR